MPDSYRTLSAAEARALLRKLRDLNLASAHVSITSDLSVAVNGCLSLDGPVEQGVRYRVAPAAGTEESLLIDWNGTGLELSLRSNGSITSSLQCSVHCDDQGRATLPELGARIDPEASEPRAIEHFLRRLIRGVYAARGV